MRYIVWRIVYGVHVYGIVYVITVCIASLHQKG